MQKDINYKLLGKKVKEARANTGLTQESLAELAGCNVSHISNIENCHTKVSLNMLFTIANILNTSIDSLLSEQYENSTAALEGIIIKELQKCSDDTKNKILKIIEILQ